MNRALGALLLASLLLLPVASASERATGKFDTEGALIFPPGTRLEFGRLDGAFLGETLEGSPALQFTDFKIKAPVLRVVEFYSYTDTIGQGILPGPLGVEGDTYEKRHIFRDVTIEIDGPTQPGYVGLRNVTSLASVGLTSLETVDAIGSTRTEMVDVMSIGPTEDDYRVRTYFHRVSGPHLNATAAGAFAFQGAGDMKLYGLPLRITHKGGTTSIETGRYAVESTDSPSPPGRYVERWITLEGEDVTFEASTPQSWILAGDAAALKWDGEAVFTAASGVLETDKTVYGSTAKPVRIEGSFDGGLSNQQQNRRLLLEFSGDLASAPDLEVTKTKITGFVPSGPSVLPLALLVGACIGGTASGILLYRRARRKSAVPAQSPTRDTGTGALPLSSPELTTEYYVSLAEQALQFEDHVKALHWITLARETAPTSAHVATTMAYVLGELGHYDEALAAYEEAARLGPVDGEADLNAARLAMASGQAPEVVEARLVRALERSPEFVVDVEEDPELRGVMDRPAVRRAVRAAWDRWGNEERAV